MMGEGLLTLTYGKHHACILNEVGAAWRGARYSDLVLVCDDAVPLAAHRIVMAAASPLIRSDSLLFSVLALSLAKFTLMDKLLEQRRYNIKLRNGQMKKAFNVAFK